VPDADVPDADVPDADVPDAGVPATRPLDARAAEEEETKTVPGLGAMDDIHREREDD
jgi:hypothetical protein